ncbi:MAG: hypothetical protein LBV54_07200, partial [Puniceicoccales bacterium]|nr:hypothetical protein [Puniceicoccales bacterium]
MRFSKSSLLAAAALAAFALPAPMPALEINERILYTTREQDEFLERVIPAAAVEPYVSAIPSDYKMIADSKYRQTEPTGKIQIKNLSGAGDIILDSYVQMELFSEQNTTFNGLFFSENSEATLVKTGNGVLQYGSANGGGAFLTLNT